MFLSDFFFVGLQFVAVGQALSTVFESWMENCKLIGNKVCLFVFERQCGVCAICCGITHTPGMLAALICWRCANNWLTATKNKEKKRRRKVKKQAAGRNERRLRLAMAKDDKLRWFCFLYLYFSYLFLAFVFFFFCSTWFLASVAGECAHRLYLAKEPKKKS